MSLVRRHGGGVILLTLVAALLLTLLPLPEWARPYRPAWQNLALIYWCMAAPQRIGVVSAWLLGLVTDITTGTLLGQHALGLAVIAYLVLHLHQRLRVFPLFQQSAVILLLLGTERVLSYWVMGAAHQTQPGSEYWIQPLVGMLLWPWVYIILRDIRRRFRVS